MRGKICASRTQIEMQLFDFSSGLALPAAIPIFGSIRMPGKKRGSVY